MVPLHRPSAARYMTGTSLVAALLTVTSPAPREILIERGDILHIAITEAPNLGGNSKVDLAGNLVLPHLSYFRVAGTGLDTVRALLQDELVKRDILKSLTVLVEVANYLPLYVGGKVRRPGAVEYDLGLTVRHAFLLAGGAGLTEEDRQPSLNISNARAKWKIGSYQLFQVG